MFENVPSTIITFPWPWSLLSSPLCTSLNEDGFQFYWIRKSPTITSLYFSSSFKDLFCWVEWCPPKFTLTYNLWIWPYLEIGSCRCNQVKRKLLCINMGTESSKTIVLIRENRDTEMGRKDGNGSLKTKVEDWHLSAVSQGMNDMDYRQPPEEARKNPLLESSER